MPPKRKAAAKGNEAKKAKTSQAADPQGRVEELLKTNTSYCDELGIDLKSEGSAGVFQWLCCSIIFGNRLSEKVHATSLSSDTCAGLRPHVPFL